MATLRTTSLSWLHQVRRMLTVAIFAIGLLVVASCSTEGKGSETNCTASSCTITFDRGVDGQASVLGIDIKLVNVKGDNVTLDIGGQEITVPHGQESEAGGANVRVTEITEDNVKLKVNLLGEG